MNEMLQHFKNFFFRPSPDRDEYDEDQLGGLVPGLRVGLISVRIVGRRRGGLIRPRRDRSD